MCCLNPAVLFDHLPEASGIETELALPLQYSTHFIVEFDLQTVNVGHSYPPIAALIGISFWRPYLLLERQLGIARATSGSHRWLEADNYTLVLSRSTGGIKLLLEARLSQNGMA